MRKRILVIDDDEGILDAFQAMLEGAGYDVEISPDIDILSKIEKSNTPDLIILDVLLSGADGREVCKELKKNNTTKHIPIILVSAHPSADKSFKEACADDFLAKPFGMKELLEKIEKFLSQ